MRIWPLLTAPTLLLVAGACGTSRSSSSSGDSGGRDGGQDGTTLDGAGSADTGTSLGGDAAAHGPCTPLTCAKLGYTCGRNADGCGNVIDCGSCTPPAFCGAGGFSVCGGNAAAADSGGNACVPESCHDLALGCGPAGDGCGNILDCGPCSFPQFCGGGGFSICGGDLFAQDGGSACPARTCQSLGFNCGPQGDGCGGLIACGTCSGADTCGGGGVPSVCGHAAVPCTNLCNNQVACDAGTTSITGQVVAATPAQYGAPDPVPNVVVYVPNGAVQPFAPGVQCNQCGADVSGSPLVQTTTGVDGTFTLSNVPVMNGMPLVIQLGRWRKQISLQQPTVACTTTPIGTITMPRTKSEGDIPLTAISTGNVDAIECVLLKMGVDPNEFTQPSSNGGTGRVQFYVGNGANEGFANPTEGALVNTAAGLSAYDEVLLPCWGDDPTLPASVAAKTPAQQSNLVQYTSNGGRVFATHYSYAWLYDAAPFSSTATWNVNSSHYASVTATIDTTSPQTSTFATWMQLIGVAPMMQFPVTLPYHDFDAVVPPSQRWVYTLDQETFPLQYTFDTPYGSSSACGRVVFSDFHVTSTTPSSGQSFPTECTGGPMTPQERALEYLLWDLGACVPGPGAGCAPLTCAGQSVACGPAGDGCGNLLQCGPCTAPDTCGGAGQPGQCGHIDAGACTPSTCAIENVSCGPAPDGCGGELECGTCTPPLQCGGGGTPGQCGLVDGGRCTPRTCIQLGLACGAAGDGCGGLLQCGTCTLPQTCGGGGATGVCGGGSL
jgi:hypothetical protein